jgi:hypothetical protein
VGGIHTIWEARVVHLLAKPILYRVFGSVTMSSSYWFSVLGWMMSGLSLPIVSFFSSFFSLYSRESKCMSSFLLVFQFHSLCFFIVYFHS